MRNRPSAISWCISHDSVPVAVACIRTMVRSEEPRRRRGGPMTVVALVALSVLIGAILFFTLAARP